MSKHIEASESFCFKTIGNSRRVGLFTPLSHVPYVVHAVTTKQGEVFPAHANDAAVEPMFGRLAGDISCDNVSWCKQVHGDTVLVVDKPGQAGDGDALITNTPGLAVLCRSADCPLVLAVDSRGTAVGIAHASWRSTIAGITGKLIRAMHEKYNCRPDKIIAAIAPSAGPERYEVGEDVYAEALESLGADAKWFFTVRDGRKYFDLWSANVSQLGQAGVEFMNIYTARICTIEHNDTFPSYRAEGKKAARFAGIIGLKTQLNSK